MFHCNKAGVTPRGSRGPHFWVFVFAVVMVGWTIMAPAKEAKTGPRFAKFDRMRVHYESYGQGSDALVFVHGWMGDLSFWKGQTPAFKDKTRVILIDLPGHGLSDKPQIAYTMDLFARAVEAVLRDLKVNRAVLVGHSMGTPVIRQFYRKYPDKTIALVIVDGSLRPFSDKAAAMKFFEPLRGSSYPIAAEHLIDGMLQPVADPALREEIKTAMLQTPQHVAVSALDGMLDEGIWQQDKITVPTLAIMSQASNWVADNEQFDRSIAPNLNYQTWPEVSHFLMMEKPKEFNEALSSFLIKIGFLKN
ncbi:MAG: alpha/beta hydrolase [Acidobacteriia bacterium]|nr:alpha/beta hydrolase [Terriglobia bacterium]